MRDSGGRAAVFAPLDLGRRADAVVRRLSEGIRLGLLRPGEQLPSESELAESFGVAPVTVREALTALREQQLVVTRRGRTGGSFVRDVPAERGRRAAGAPAGGRPVPAARPRRPLRRRLRHSAQLAAERAGGEDVLAAHRGRRGAAPRGGGRRRRDAGRRAESRFHVASRRRRSRPGSPERSWACRARSGPLLWLPRPRRTPPGPRCCAGRGHPRRGARLRRASRALGGHRARVRRAGQGERRAADPAGRGGGRAVVSPRPAAARPRRRRGQLRTPRHHFARRWRGAKSPQGCEVGRFGSGGWSFSGRS